MNEPTLAVAIAVYDTHPQAEEAIRKLQHAGFDMRSISIIGKDYHSEEHVRGYLNIGDRARFFGKFGAFWGGLAGLLTGSALLFVPVVGHLIVLGPLAASLIGGIEGAALGGGAGAALGALTTMGVPRDTMLRYETALKADKFLLVMDTDAAAAAQARALLGGDISEVYPADAAR